MLSLDWKERLKKDTIDFYERKLANKEFDIDIVYNAYPERIDNKVPQVVITFVAKTIASKMGKEAENYFDFYDYILEKKGESGKIIFAYIMAKALKKKPEKFMDYLEKILLSIDDQRECNLIIDKAIYPIVKKDPLKYIDLFKKWMKHDNEHLLNSLQKVFIKLISADPELIKPIFQRLETTWLYASPSMIKLNIQVLKAIQKIDQEFYLNVYKHYHFTRNPIFAEILCGALLVRNDDIFKIVENWSKSGNIKLKKIGLHGLKILKKKKGK
ncbi:MAG: hypothetical protein K8S23_04325 [Candidatus Cloacimonetes bacterium]|nr:hypothetical protein [Candidatus Cloacimonadota bacterium]